MSNTHHGNNDLRLIEDYLPIEAISAEASREKSVRKGHISTLHLWWARRPLVACRAAVYGALVPADRWVKDLDVKNPPADPAKAEAFKNGTKRGLNRKHAKEFVTKLCRYPKSDPTKPEDIKLKRETEAAIVEAQKHILEAHADRLTAELAEAKKTGTPPAWVEEFKFQGDKVTCDDILAGRAPRPRVLDMFAGGGAIPLEALRLGCEAYALDLNPVAHIIQLCTLVYPQKYGKPDPTQPGMCGASVPLASTQPMSYQELLDLVGYFNPEEPLDIRERRLPHWRQPGVTYFVTFRLADALPQERVETLRAERELWLRTHREPYSPERRREFYRLFSERVENWLDEGAGECLLRDQSLARIVADALKHFDGQRYDLLAWVVMPNHVHVLVTPRSGFDLPGILHSWKSFTAHEINKALGRSGQLWQHESYDHIVRNPQALSRIARYITENPAKAGITTKFVENRIEGNREVGKPEACPTVTTWGGLADEVRYWGNWVLERVRKQIGDLYPPVPDPAFWDTPPEIAFDRKTGQWNITSPGKPKRGAAPETAPTTSGRQMTMHRNDDEEEDDENAAPAITLPPGFLQPVAYLWTRTVRCKNPGCAATVPLVRQTWLCKKKGRYVALKMIAGSASVPLARTGKPRTGKPRTGKPEACPTFEVVESDTEQGLGFDPAGFSKAGNATCPFCGTVADNDYVKSEGRAGRMGTQPMAVVCTRPGRQGKVYLSGASVPLACLPDDDAIRQRIAELCERTGLTVPDEPIITDAKNSCWTHLYGLTTFGHLFTPRQMLSLLCFTAAVRDAHTLIPSPEHAKAVGTLLACAIDKVADIGCNLAAWEAVAQCTRHLFGRQAIPMAWDFGEAVAYAGSAGDWNEHLERVLDSLQLTYDIGQPSFVSRGSATAQPYAAGSLDAVITDPPYYDNVPYADISDFFYVWLKRSVGHVYPEHFATAGTPKKQEAVADATRHGGDKNKAVRAYEQMMAQSLAEAHRVLKPGGTLAVVYAHKTTLGWSTLVEAIRRAGFTVTEAWPLDTENTSRLRAIDSAALASSIFLVGRKRGVRGASVGGASVPLATNSKPEACPTGKPVNGKPEACPTLIGSYEDEVQPELEQIVRERVETLWEMGIAGADLVIACVGAGLRAFTKYEKVEYANGEEVPAEKFLAEVEGVVLDTMLTKLSGATGGNVSAVDNASRFYVLWRFVYKTAELDAGEAIIFANGTHIELDGPQGLSTGKDALVEKKRAKYRARDYTERGDDTKLGLPNENGQPAPLIDALHRILWLMENSPRKLNDFLDEARPDRERLRVLAQALAGAALSGKSEEESAKLVSTTAAEQAALGKLLANWRSLVENRLAAEEGTLFGKK